MSSLSTLPLSKPSAFTPELRFGAAAAAAVLAGPAPTRDRLWDLPALVARADIAFFPVDCVSHLAAGQVKRLCRQAGKTYMPLRSASVACFLGAIADLPRP